MSYTTDRYPLLKKRSEQSDLLKDAEDAFFGGGQGGSRPTPTPKPTPVPTSLAMLGQPIGLGTSNGASRTRSGLTNPAPDETAYPTNVGSLGFNRSLNGVQPQQSFIPTPSRPMTPTEMASDIAKRNLTATGSSLGTSSTANAPLPSGVQPYIGPEEAAQKGLQWTGGDAGWQPYISPEQMTARNLQYTGGPSAGSVNAPSQQTTKFLPPGFTTAVGSTGAPNSTPNDIHFLPPGFTSVQGTVGDNKQLQFQPPNQQKDQGYGSAYGY